MGLAAVSCTVLDVRANERGQLARMGVVVTSIPCGQYTANKRPSCGDKDRKKQRKGNVNTSSIKLNFFSQIVHEGHFYQDSF